MRASRRLGRLIVTTVVQAGGAPLVDSALITDIDGNRYKGRCIVWRRSEQPQRAFVIGWRQQP